MTWYVSGSRAPKEYSNLPCVNIDGVSISYCTLGHTEGPFRTPPFSNLQVYPNGVIPKEHSSELRRPTSVTAHVPPESYSLQYIKIDHAIA